MLLTSGAVLAITGAAYFIYEFMNFRQNAMTNISTLGKIIAANSTAALAFDSQEEAIEILSALRAEQHILAANLYTEEGELFAWYPKDIEPVNYSPDSANAEGYFFRKGFLEGFEPVVQGERRLGLLYLRFDMEAIYVQLRFFVVAGVFVTAISILLALAISNKLQKGISRPILTLAETAKVVSEKKDYSVRAEKSGNDELGDLTDAFNHMLGQIEEQNLEIRSFNLKLEQRVTERTNELKMANKELEAFTYSVSHDLRAPLRAIHGYMNILIEDYGDRLDDEAKKVADVIQNNTIRMSRLIDDLLEFSRISRMELTKSNIPMKRIAQSIWTELAEMAPERTIDFTLGELPDAYGDYTTIKQVWTNLISNAIKYTANKEKASVKIGSKNRKGTIIYYVKDNGAGFDMRYYNKLFGVFQRLHSLKEFQGTGVGLAIVQRIIAKHGGTIWAQAAATKGATFYFTLTPYEKPGQKQS